MPTPRQPEAPTTSLYFGSTPLRPGWNLITLTEDFDTRRLSTPRSLYIWDAAKQQWYQPGAGELIPRGTAVWIYKDPNSPVAPEVTEQPPPQQQPKAPTNEQPNSGGGSGGSSAATGSPNIQAKQPSPDEGQDEGESLIERRKREDAERLRFIQEQVTKALRAITAPDFWTNPQAQYELMTAVTTLPLDNMREYADWEKKIGQRMNVPGGTELLQLLDAYGITKYLNAIREWAKWMTGQWPDPLTRAMSEYDKELRRNNDIYSWSYRAGRGIKVPDILILGSSPEELQQKIQQIVDEYTPVMQKRLQNRVQHPTYSDWVRQFYAANRHRFGGPPPPQNTAGESEQGGEEAPAPPPQNTAGESEQGGEEAPAPPPQAQPQSQPQAPPPASPPPSAGTSQGGGQSTGGQSQPQQGGGDAGYVVQYPPEVYENLPALRFLRGELTPQQYLTLAAKPTKIPALGNIEVPAAPNIGYRAYLTLAQSPVGIEALRSLWKAANRDFDAEMITAEAAAPRGSAAETTLVRY